MILKTLVIDDEPLAQDIIRKYAEDVHLIEIKAFCNDAIEAIEELRAQKIDLIFLDINMPKLSGIEFIKTLTNPPLIVITSAYTNYALEGYELNVLDYLAKPFSFTRFLKAVQKAEQQFQQNRSQEPEEKSESIFVKSNKKSYQVNFNDINYIEGLGDYIKIYTEKSHFVTNYSMKKIEELLPKNEFIRIHKSFIVNLKKIISIEGNLVEVQNRKLTIGNNYRADFFSVIGHKSI
jgi:DNA-binding LytR/AlgR family response regulator